MAVPGAGETINGQVLGWEGVQAAPHRFGGVEYRLGKREIGHVHGDSLVDIPFPRRLRDELVSSGQAQPHHVLPETGWVSFYIQQEPDVERAIALLRRSYEVALRQRGGTAPAPPPADPGG